MLVPYFPFSGEPYRPQMGLKPLHWAQWLEIDGFFLPHLALKKKLFLEERQRVLAVHPGSDSFCLELHGKLRSHLLQFHSGYVLDGGRFQVLATGETFTEPSTGEEALEQVSRWVQEDWCLLSPESPNSLVAAFVCFPSRWSLREKMGKDPDQVHEGVPDYGTLLSAPAKNFLQKLTPEKPMWRLNWTVHDSDQLFCPGPFVSQKKLDANNVLENCFLRVERQTLSRLPKTGAIAFSIRTHLNPLGDLLQDPSRLKIFRDSLLGLPEETAIYRGMGPFLSPLKEALLRL